MNIITVIGRLTRDPELRFTSEGKAVATLRLAVPRRKKDAEPVYIDVVTWGEQAKVCAEHLHKGRQIGITGRLEDRHWQADDGSKRTSYEIVANTVDFLGSPSKSGEPEGAQPVEDLEELF